MGVSVTSSRLVGTPNSRVYVNGSLRRDIEVLQVSRGSGISPSVCDMELPYAYFEDNIAALDDAEVVVYGRSGTGDFGRPIFRGWIDLDQRAEGGARKSVTVRARSVWGLLDRLPVGLLRQSSVLRFPRRDVNNVLTGETMSTVLEKLFSEDYMPSQWRSKLKLGNMAAIRKTERDIALPDQIYVAASYLDAISRLLEFNRRVNVEERFESDATYLDWFVANDTRGSVVDIKAATSTVGPEQGVLLASLAARRNSMRIRNRCIGYGANDEIMLTVGTDPAASGQEAMTPAWNSPSSYADLTAFPTNEDELAVLANPNIAIKGTESFDPKYRFIFRLYKLPESVRQHVIMNRNILEDTLRRPMEIQFFRQQYQYSNADRGIAGKEDYDVEGAIDTNNYHMISGSRFLSIGNVVYVYFAKPLLALYLQKFDEDRSSIFVYRRVHGYVTFSIQHATTAIRYDTGVRAETSHPSISMVGLPLEFKNQDLKRTRIGTSTDELVDTAGNTYTYGARWYDADNKVWRSHSPVGTPEILQDDSLFLANIAEGEVAEIRARPWDGSVTMAGIWPGYRVGRIMRVLNRGIDSVRLQIHQIDYNFTNGTTTLRGTDAPPDVNDVMAKHPIKRRQGRSKAMSIYDLQTDTKLRTGDLTDAPNGQFSMSNATGATYGPFEPFEQRLRDAQKSRAEGPKIAGDPRNFNRRMLSEIPSDRLTNSQKDMRESDLGDNQPMAVRDENGNTQKQFLGTVGGRKVSAR